MVLSHAVHYSESRLNLLVKPNFALTKRVREGTCLVELCYFTVVATAALGKCTGKVLLAVVFHLFEGTRSRRPIPISTPSHLHIQHELHRVKPHEQNNSNRKHCRILQPHPT